MGGENDKRSKEWMIPISITLSLETLKKIDKERNGIPRSVYLREIISNRKAKS